MTNTAEEFISLPEAEKLTGLSATTISRFAQAGYFPTSQLSDGTTSVATKELCELLKIPVPEIISRVKNTIHSVNEDSTIGSDTAHSSTVHNYIDMSGRTSADYEGVVIEFPSKAKEAEPRAKSLETATTDSQKPSKVEISNSPSNNSTTESVCEPLNSDSPNEPAELSDLRSEIAKLQKVTELQEQLLASQEHEIKDLRKQRKWLQERVEKLENQAERDQLLLISETQMLTKMFVQYSQRKSVFTQALEWLGVKIANATTQSTIEHKPSKEE